VTGRPIDAAGRLRDGSAARPEDGMDPVIAAYAYRDGRRLHPVSVDGTGDPPREAGDFVWIGLHEPDAATMARLQGCYGLHPLAVEDAMAPHKVPKCEAYGSSLFIVLRTAELMDGQIEMGETHIFIGPGYIITVRHGSTRAHTPLRKRLEASPEQLRHGVDYVLHGILDFVVDNYLPVIQSIEDEVAAMERRTLDTPLRRQEIQRIFQLRAELQRLSRVTGPMGEVCARIEHVDMPFLDAAIRPYFRDVHDHVRRVNGSIDNLRALLSFVFEAGVLLESQRQGEITRRFAAWAAILAVPTAVAGIYGMNFDHMPELQWRYGYFLVLGLILTLCGGLYYRFRRARWL
jgi:magnesium transporter